MSTDTTKETEQEVSVRDATYQLILRNNGCNSLLVNDKEQLRSHKIHSLTTETMKPIRKDSRRHYPLLLTSRLSYQLFPHCLVQLLFSWMDLTSSHITPAKHSFIAFWTLFNPAELAVTLNAVLPS